MTYKIGTSSRNRSSVDCKWMFRTKRDAIGMVLRHKARLVAKGYSQVVGIDFNEIYTSITKFTTIKTIVAIRAIMVLKIHQIDIKTIFFE